MIQNTFPKLSHPIDVLRDQYPMKTKARLCCTIVCASLGIALVLSPKQARAYLVASHVGSTDPTTEGWAPSSPTLPANQSVGPINDGGTPAWFVNDASTTSGYFYSKTVPPAEVADANSIGWKLSVTLRVPDTGDIRFQRSPFVSFTDGVTDWFVGFERAGADTLVRTFEFQGDSDMGPSYTVSGGTAAYITYTLQKAPASPTAQLFVNGVERIADYTGSTLAPADIGLRRVAWGGGSALDIGQGNFSTVSFDIAPVPEAGSLLLVGLAGVLAVVIRRLSTK
jgi:hypothetical protein